MRWKSYKEKESSYGNRKKSTRWKQQWMNKDQKSALKPMRKMYNLNTNSSLGTKILLSIMICAHFGLKIYGIWCIPRSGDLKSSLKFFCLNSSNGME